MRHIFVNINTYLETCFLVFAIVLLLIHIQGATESRPIPSAPRQAATQMDCGTTEVVWRLSDNHESTYTERLVATIATPLPIPSPTKTTVTTSSPVVANNQESTITVLEEIVCQAPRETPFIIVNDVELLVSVPEECTTETVCQDDVVTASPTPVRPSYIESSMATPAYENDLISGSSSVEITDTKDTDPQPTKAPRQYKKRRSRRR